MYIESGCVQGTVMTEAEDDNISRNGLIYTNRASVREALMSGMLEFLKRHNGHMGGKCKFHLDGLENFKGEVTLAQDFEG